MSVKKKKGKITMKINNTKKNRNKKMYYCVILVAIIIAVIVGSYLVYDDYYYGYDSGELTLSTRLKNSNNGDYAITLQKNPDTQDRSIPFIISILLRNVGKASVRILPFICGFTIVHYLLPNESLLMECVGLLIPQIGLDDRSLEVLRPGEEKSKDIKVAIYGLDHLQTTWHGNLTLGYYSMDLRHGEHPTIKRTYWTGVVLSSNSLNLTIIP